MNTNSAIRASDKIKPDKISETHRHTMTYDQNKSKIQVRSLSSWPGKSKINISVHYLPVGTK